MRIASSSVLAELGLRMFVSRTPGEHMQARRAEAALHTYQDFLAKNPELPGAHRDRFLAEIACCEAEAKEERMAQSRSATRRNLLSLIGLNPPVR